MPVVDVPMSDITDWESFHDTFTTALGFADFYGRNMDAWIDCLTYADEDEGTSTMVVPEGDVLTLQLTDCADFRRRCPGMYAALIECAAFVNWRRIELGARAILALSFN